jgi:hypothetical protein
MEMMTVKELINELLNCDMYAEVKIDSYGNKDVKEIEYDEDDREYIIKLVK